MVYKIFNFLISSIVLLIFFFSVGVAVKATLSSQSDETAAAQAYDTSEKEPTLNVDKAHFSEAFISIDKLKEHIMLDLPIVDVRSRDEFKLQNVKGSVNIPTDEMEIRARHELPKDLPLVVICNYKKACELKAFDGGYFAPCNTVALILKRNGFSSVKVFEGNIDSIINSSIEHN